MERQGERARLREIAGVCLEAGRLMLSSGAETSRVEETVRRLGAACGTEVECFVTPTGITLAAGTDRTVTRVARIHRRGIDLNRVASVNSISRGLEAGVLDLFSAARALESLAAEPPRYSLGARYLAQGVATGGFALILGSGPADLAPAVLAGFLVRALEERVTGVLPLFLNVFLCSLALTGWALLAGSLFPGVAVDKVALAAILPLMPGLALTNAVRDLLAGDLVSGVSRGADALLQAAAIAAGVVVALSASHGWLA